MKIIKLAKEKGEVLVDDKDFEWLSKFKWRIFSTNYNHYAESTINNKNIKMHRLILNAPNGMVVDHKNGKGLDNRRSNIRLATTTQNLANIQKINSKCGLKGVTYNDKGNRKKCWIARISINNKQKTIGTFLTKEEAGRAYDKEAKKIWGEFAYTNEEFI